MKKTWNEVIPEIQEMINSQAELLDQNDDTVKDMSIKEVLENIIDQVLIKTLGPCPNGKWLYQTVDWYNSNTELLMDMAPEGEFDPTILMSSTEE